ncbi:MAG TPA: response regulator [Candidatus Deferrimicrobium sp.]|nr:response regulator [Candidatus Deferrimicrobium sp.]
MKILIVDDSIHFLNALGAILREAGYSDVVMKESAPEAIEFLRSPECRSRGNHVDVILMDVIMPGMDGLEAVRLIKKDPELIDIPIVMVSVEDEEQKIKQAFDAGAIDFIDKPIKKLELLARVRSILRLKEEMDRRKNREKELEKTVEQLRKAISELKTLSGLLPICSYCKKIRDDQGYWQQVEAYIAEHSEAGFSHSICPECLKEHYPDYAQDVLKQSAKKENQNIE